MALLESFEVSVIRKGHQIFRSLPCILINISSFDDFNSPSKVHPISFSVVYSKVSNDELYHRLFHIPNIFTSQEISCFDS